MTDGREKDPPNQQERLPSSPDGYLRISDLEKLFKTMLALFAIGGTGFGGLKYADALRDYVDRVVLNERNERLNQFNRLDSRLDRCCSKY